MYQSDAMDIGLVIPSSYLHTCGGSEVSEKLLAESLVRRGHKVTVYAFDGDAYSETRLNGVDIKVFRKLREGAPRLLSLNVSTYVHLRHLVGSHDVIHVYRGWQLLAAEAFNVPTVATLNSYQLICPIETLLSPSGRCNGLRVGACVRCIYSHFGFSSLDNILKTSFYFRNVLYGYLSLKADRRVDKYIALSVVLKLKFVKKGIADDKIVVIPNMVDPCFINSNSTESRGILTILYVGQLYEAKGVDVLLNAVHLLRKSEVKLKIVGHGRKESELKELARNLGVSEKVEFLGKIENKDLPEIYRSADLFVHPGIWEEPFGRSVLEAMASGLPVITSDVGAPPYLAQGCGLIFTAGDAEELASAISILLDDVELRKELGVKARNKAVKEHDVDLIAERIEKVYLEALTGS
jgi:glycosyltransferase involved in cell wall biosynthesis